MNIKANSLSIMTYSHDGFGLGHIKRNSIIARHGIDKIPNSRFLMITSCPFPPFFTLPHGIDYIKLPSIIKVNTGIWRARTLSGDIEDFKRFRTTLIRDSVDFFKPDIFLVDYLPAGVWGELLPIFNHLKKQENNPKIILGLRDIIDRPEHVKALWEKEGVYDILIEYYDKIIVYGSEEIYDTANQYGINGPLAEKVVYSGYLCSKTDLELHKNIQEKQLRAHDKLIVVTGGGGYDAYPLMKLSIKALRNVLSKLSAHAVFITGPLMDRDDYNKLKTLSRDLPVKIIRNCDTSEFIHSAELIITMAGYNTLMDAIYAEKKIITMPRKGPSIEQRLRVKLFEKLGILTSINPVNMPDCNELTEMIIEQLKISKKPTLKINIDGLNRVIDEMESLALEDKK